MKILGKFGFDHCDLPTMFDNIAALLRVNSINIDRNKKHISWIVHAFVYIGLGCYLYVYELSMLWFSFVRCPQTGDFLSAAVEFSIGTASGTCLTKFFYMKICSNTVTNLVEDFLQCDLLVVPNTRYASNLLKMLRVVKKRASIIWMTLVSNGAIYVILPLMLPGRHLSEDLFVIYGLEPMLESPNFEIANTLMFLAVIFAVFTLANTITFIIIAVGYLEVKMLALSEELKHLWDDSKIFIESICTTEDKGSGTAVDEDVRAKTDYKLRNIFIKNSLRNIVKFHIICINLRNNLEKELRLIFVVDFLMMVSGLISELLGGLENTYIQMPYTLIQVFIECLIGQRLLDASNVFEAAVYGCQWEKFDVTNQKTVYFMLQSSQKSLTMSAGGIAVLSFTSLMFVIRATYSTYTTLQSNID